MKEVFEAVKMFYILCPARVDCCVARIFEKRKKIFGISSLEVEEGQLK